MKCRCTRAITSSHTYKYADFVLKTFTTLKESSLVNVEGFRMWKEDDDDETEGKAKVS